MNSINQKSICAVVAIGAVYLLAFKVAQPETDLRGAIGGVVFSLLVFLPAAALVLAVLGLREIHGSRRANGANRAGNTGQHYWPAIGAFLFAFSFIVPFGLYGVARWRHNTTALPASSASPGWSRFTSSTADFSALFPVAPSEDTQTVQRPGGPASLHVMMASVGPEESYSVTRAEAPSNDPAEGATAALDRLEADFVKGNGPPRARADVTSGSVVGRELRIDTAAKSLRVRFFSANRHVYMVLVMRPRLAGESGLDTRFLDSFSLQGS
jgi:hypothetical protein